MEQMIVSALKATRRIEREVLAKHGLTCQQYAALLALRDQPLSMGKWAASLEAIASGMTPMADRLEVAGWIHRVSDSTDRRVTLVSLRDVERLVAIVAEVIQATDRVMEESAGAVRATS